MPKIQSNNCEMYYEVDDYTDPWLSRPILFCSSMVSAAVPGSGITGFLPWRGAIELCAVTCVAMVNRVIQGVTTNGQSTN